jgi:uncharacterized protein YidB (DUF937 family)
MGMIEGLLSSLLSGLSGGGSGAAGLGGGGQQSPLLQVALQLMQQNGGLAGVLGKFQQAGYGSQADSWVSTGQNLPISGDVLQQVLGAGALGQIAQHLGMSQGAVAGNLADTLPNVIDRMTPQGRIPEGGDDMVEQVLALLTKSQHG